MPKQTATNTGTFLLYRRKEKDTALKANQTKLITDSVPWAGISGKYFSLIVIPSVPAQQILYSAAQPNADTVQDGQLFSRPVITGNKVTDVYRIYLGPCSENILSTYNIPSKTTTTMIICGLIPWLFPAAFGVR